MKYSDIKIKHIYNVIFDPVEKCEFNGKHLALVLKRNNDKKTFIVMPLTSEPNGDGVNKYKLGKIPSLPNSLKINDTYAVFNQIRTVNASRFISLKEGSTVIESSIDDSVFVHLLQLSINELVFHLDNEQKIQLFKQQLNSTYVNKAIDIAYNILKLQNDIHSSQEELILLNATLSETLQNISYTLEQKHIDNGIQKVFENALKRDD